jgi:hypothetical protein
VDDGEWRAALEEAAHMMTGYSLHLFFATILQWCEPCNPGQLWYDFWEYICDDLIHQIRRSFNVQGPSPEQQFDYGLHLLNDIRLDGGTSLHDYPSMPLSLMDWSRQNGCNWLISEQLEYNAVTE